MKINVLSLFSGVGGIKMGFSLENRNGDQSLVPSFAQCNGKGDMQRLTFPITQTF